MESLRKDEGRLENVIKTIQSHLFWFHIAELEEIVTPISDAQIRA
jgi:hypothetical protein